MKKEKIKVFELFSGVGAPLMALKKAGIKYDSLGYSEIDTGAIKIYKEIHEDKSENYGDITKIESLPKGIDLLVHGSPCQDFSIAGLRKGGNEGAGTRSSLMWESVRLINEAKPKVVLWENVVGVLCGEMKENFIKYLNVMESLGYKSSYDILNGIDFDIPQKRRRVFVLSFLDHNEFVNIKWVKKKESTKRLIDILESDVDKKFYISEDKLCKVDIKNRRLNIKNFEQDDRFSYPFEVNDTLVTKRQSKILIPENTKLGYKEAYVGDGIYLDRPNQKRGTVQKQSIQTLKTSAKDVGVIDQNYRIRYLIPLEYWRLMGFSDSDFLKASRVAKETALYKAAGNSIIVDVLEAIFNLIYKEEMAANVQMSLF